MDKDRVEGSLHQAKGKVKEAAGKVMGDAKSEAEGKTEKDGLATLHGAVSKQQQQDSLWIVARSQGDVAVVTPGGYSFSIGDNEKWASYVYTDRPVYRPGHTVHWKGILRAERPRTPSA